MVLIKAGRRDSLGLERQTERQRKVKVHVRKSTQERKAEAEFLTARWMMLTKYHLLVPHLSGKMLF